MNKQEKTFLKIVYFDLSHQWYYNCNNYYYGNNKNNNKYFY